MTNQRVSPFETLESAYEFVSLLRVAADEEYASILDEIALAQATPDAGRRLDALRLVNHKLDALRQHLLASLILINDLRNPRTADVSHRRRSFACSIGRRAAL
jgi:hypothetical protein